MTSPLFKSPIPLNYLDTDTALTANSDVKVPSQKAVKAYADTKAPALGADDNYVTDAEKTVIGNTSGTNTGDEVEASQAEVITATEQNKYASPLAVAPYANHNMSRNSILNPNFNVWQRGTSLALADVTASYLADKWFDYHDKNGGTLPTLTRSRQLITSGDLFNSFYTSRLAMNGTGTSLGVNSLGYYAQRIEHGTRNLCGNGKTVTFAFYAKSDVAGKKLGVCLFQGYGTGGSPTAQETITGSTITLTSSWVRYTFTFTTNTLSGKTFGTADDDVLTPAIFYMWGDTIGDAFGFTGAETYGNGFVDIAQAPLCKGSVALKFEPRSYNQELLDCLRYCYVPETAQANALLGIGNAVTNAIVFVYIKFPVQMRVNPTLTATGSDWEVIDGATATAMTAMENTTEQSWQTKDSVVIRCNVAGTPLTQFRFYAVRADGNANRLAIFHADL